MDKTLPQRLQALVEGSFEKTVLIQKRIRDLVRGGTPLFDHELEGIDDRIEIAIIEIERGLISLEDDEKEEKLTL